MVKLHAVRKRQEGLKIRRQYKKEQKFIGRGEYLGQSTLKTRILAAVSSFVILIGLSFYASSAKAFPESRPSNLILDPSLNKEALPSLNDFIAQVQHEGVGPQGVWAEGLFAYAVDSTCWGCVPEQMNTAAYSTVLGKYHGLFIHNYMGGDQLYSAESGSIFSIIYSDRIEWFQIVGKYIYAAPPQPETCIYDGTGPFSVWGTDSQDSITVLDVLEGHFTMDQWAIQTSVCEDGEVGFLVVNATRIEIEILQSLEKEVLIKAQDASPSSVAIPLEKE